METIAHTFIIPSGQNHFIQEIVFNNAPIIRVTIAKFFSIIKICVCENLKLFAEVKL